MDIIHTQKPKYFTAAETEQEGHRKTACGTSLDEV